ncbi:MAG: hypothetical protein M0R03_15465 [Novosphingobium sp.]|nr:hypothetical protein [Novosphingobium sp.]
MKHLLYGLGIVAMLPAALNLGATAQARTLVMPVCTGDGTVHMMRIPLDPADPASGQTGCCVKGCHAGSSRKRGDGCC